MYGRAVNAAQVLDHLTRGAGPSNQLEAAAAPGVYAYFLAAGSSLPGMSNPGSDALYIGVSSNLSEREFDTHFAEGKTGFSTLRRSIGAILKDQLRLRVRPRGIGASKTDFTNFRFDDEGERRLSAWMLEHLRVAVEPVPQPDELERQLIELACPPLNLKGWPNPEAPTIRALRRACADEARRDQPRE